jgi:hypothetical protein
MPITHGRGDESKKKILETYKLQAVMHAPLLNGKAIQCVCNDKVTGNFYQFDALDPDTGKTVDTLYAGESCARKLLELSATHGKAPITPIPLFNPLHVLRERNGGGHGGGNAAENQDGAKKTHPLNVEVEQAIYLTLLCWGELPTPGQAFSDILAEIRRRPDRPLLDMRVRSVNTAIGNKRSKGLTLTQMLAVERANNPNLKHYAFPLMTAALKREEEKKEQPFPSNL